MKFIGKLLDIVVYIIASLLCPAWGTWDCTKEELEEMGIKLDYPDLDSSSRS